jgi:hypothetical protein
LTNKPLVDRHPTSAAERLDEFLSKAVAAHESQLRQRNKSGRFVVHHPSRTQPRNEKGRFVGRLPESERSAAAARLPGICKDLRDRLADHESDCENGHLSAIRAGKRGRRDIAKYYEDLYRVGMQAAGNPGIILSSTDRAMINRAAADEADYFDAFMADVHAGRGKMPYQKRLDCYENAGKHAYWLGWTMAYQSPKRRITWHWGDTVEHCAQCLPLAQKGPMTVAVFVKEALSHGYVPQSGDLECKGIRCKCYLTDEYVGKSSAHSPNESRKTH